MGKDNNSNPFSSDPGQTQREVPLPLQKARVVAAKPQSSNAFHTVRVQLYGDRGNFLAPVLTPMPGCSWVPEAGTDVAVLFAAQNKPWVVGSWYALDRVEEGDVDIPDYEPGDIRIGNESGSHVTVHQDGNITIQASKFNRVDIDKQTAITYMGTDQDIAGDNNYDVLEFDTVESDPESLFDTSAHEFTLRHDGLYEIVASCEIQAAGQNNSYTIAVFVNGSLEKRKTEQSATNTPLSINMILNKQLDANDTVDVRLRQNSGATKTVDGQQITNEFTLIREGINVSN